MPNVRTCLSKAFYAWSRWSPSGGYMASMAREAARLERLQWLAPEQVERRQLAKLQRLLAHAVRHVPYYRALHARGDMPDHLDRLEQMATLPAVTKDLVVQCGREFISETADRSRLIARRSGGSTGQTLSFYISNATAVCSGASEAWGNAMAGYRLGDPIVSLWGSHFEALAAPSPRQRLATYLKNHDTLITDRMDEPQIHALLRALDAIRPAVLVGYTSPMVELARYMLAHSIRPKFPLRSVVSAAEPLSPAQRELLQRAFRKRVFDRYGTREAGLIACECDRHDGLHVNCEALWLDLDECRDLGGARRVLATRLDELDMPLIRYDLGDYTFGCKRYCPCGRGWAVIPNIRGRQISTLRLRDGTAIAGEVFIALLDCQPIHEYRVVQEADYSVRLELVPEPGYDSAVEQKILEVIDQIMRRSLPLKVEVRQRIERTLSGKLLPIVSRVKAGSETADQGEKT